MILSFTVGFGAKYLTGMVTSVSPNEAFSLIKTIFFVSLKSSKVTSKIQFLRYVTFRSRWLCDIQFHMLFISTVIFDDKLRPQILSVGKLPFM